MTENLHRHIGKVMISSDGTFLIRFAHQKPCGARWYSQEELHKCFVRDPPEEMCSRIVLCFDPERNTFVCLDCSFPSVLLQAQDQMQKCSGCIYISDPLMLMTEQSVLSRGVSHKFNVVIRGVEDLFFINSDDNGKCWNGSSGVAIIILSSPLFSPLNPPGPCLQNKWRPCWWIIIKQDICYCQISAQSWLHWHTRASTIFHAGIDTNSESACFSGVHFACTDFWLIQTQHTGGHLTHTRWQICWPHLRELRRHILPWITIELHNRYCGKSFRF